MLLAHITPGEVGPVLLIALLAAVLVGAAWHKTRH